jgi:hypothetical protein
MNLSIILGRGRLLYDEKKRPILGIHRQAIYERISSISGTLSERGWPLCLLYSHSLIVAASVTSESLSLHGNLERDPDIFLVNGFIEELSKTLANESNLTSQTNEGDDALPCRLPVSFHDARIFLACFARISIENQNSTFLSLISQVERGLSMLDKRKLLIDSSSSTSSFLARMVTLTINAYILMRFGSHAEEELHRAIGRSLSLQTPAPHHTADRFNKEKSFVGVFSDWKDSEIPPIKASAKNMEAGLESKFYSILRSAFSLGFTTAKVDNGHLLFASWNALGNVDLWKDIQLHVKISSETSDNLSEVILELRDDVCLVHRLIMKLHGAFSPTSGLMRVIEEKERSLRSRVQRSLASDVKSNLGFMIQKACKLADNLLSKYSLENTSSNSDFTATELPVLLEMIAIYVSFAVSSCTKPRNDFFSMLMLSMTERTERRACSTDSVSVHSEESSHASQSVLADALERLQEICETFGAVPAHPDWLDIECHLLESFSYEDAATTAADALKCLNKIINFGHSHMQRQQRLAFQHANVHNYMSSVNLATKLCWLEPYQTKDSTFCLAYDRNERKYAHDVGTFCHLDSSILDLILNGEANSKRHEAKAFWANHSAQRILGRLQDVFRCDITSEVDSPELRAGGEWEVLLARALTSACVCIDQGKRNASLSGDSYDYVGRLEQWAGMCWTAIDALVPTAALLRYGLCCSGRIIHPLRAIAASSAGLETDESQKELSIEERVWDIHASSSVVEETSGTLTTLALFPDSETSEAIAAHLLSEFTSFSTLKAVYVCKCAIHAVTELQDLVHRDDYSEGSEALQVMPYLMEYLAAILDLFGCSHAKCQNKKMFPFQHLFGAMSTKNTLFPENLKTFFVVEGDIFATMLQSAMRRQFFVSFSCVEEAAVLFIRATMRYSIYCVQSETKAFFAYIAASLATIEFVAQQGKENPSLDLLSFIVSFFNNRSDVELSSLVDKLLMCAAEGTHPVPSSHSFPAFDDSLCVLFIFLLSTRSKMEKFRGSPLVVEKLLNSYNRWKNIDALKREQILGLALLYSTRTGKLFEFGERIVNDIRLCAENDSDNNRLSHNLKIFTSFLDQIRDCFSGNEVSVGICTGQSSAKRGEIPPLPSTCSYANRTDFHEQHWYNCFTCGLTSDKGCCTLCAVVCHEGHDVAYSRFGSFFCGMNV